jgi:hypothetical protein
MLNKKMILCVVIIVTITTITIGNSWAYLISSSSEATTKPITVKTIQLTINPDTSLITIKDVLPGSTGTLYQTITNSGAVPGKLNIKFDTISESIATEIPTATGTSTLLDSVMVNMKLVKTSDDSLVKQLAGSDSNPVPIASCSGLSVSNIPMDSNTSYKLVVDYEIPSKTDTGIQGKKLSFGITYILTT